MIKLFPLSGFIYFLIKYLIKQFWRGGGVIRTPSQCALAQTQASQDSHCFIMCCNYALTIVIIHVHCASIFFIGPLESIFTYYHCIIWPSVNNKIYLVFTCLFSHRIKKTHHLWLFIVDPMSFGLSR